MLLFISADWIINSVASYFNTSHVTVYPRYSSDCTYQSSISIHLMLLFIKHHSNDFLSLQHFNTSHVTVYHSRAHTISRVGQFQYISCYCLSVSGDANDILALHFNTSHVTVYRWIEAKFSFDFRNFNTSHVTVYRQPCGDIRCATIFQYISCYCLSNPNRSKKKKIFDFNTSHVTVYLRQKQKYGIRDCISIHLMLLFIHFGGFLFFIPIIFQYISCYCLSFAYSARTAHPFQRNGALFRFKLSKAQQVY